MFPFQDIEFLYYVYLFCCRTRTVGFASDRIHCFKYWRFHLFQLRLLYVLRDRTSCSLRKRRGVVTETYIEKTIGRKMDVCKCSHNLHPILYAASKTGKENKFAIRAKMQKVSYNFLTPFIHVVCFEFVFEFLFNNELHFLLFTLYFTSPTFHRRIPVCEYQNVI